MSSLPARKGPRRIARSAAELGAVHWGRLFYRVQLPVPAVNPGKNNGNTVIHSTLVGLTATRPTGSGTAEYRVLDTIMNEGKKHNFIYNVRIQGGSGFGHENGVHVRLQRHLDLRRVARRQHRQELHALSARWTSRE